MRKYSWLLAVVISLFVFASAQAAGSQDAKSQAAKKLDELRQLDLANAKLRIEWETEVSHLGQLQRNTDEKRSAFEKAKDAYDKAEKNSFAADELAKLAGVRKNADFEWRSASGELNRQKEAVQSLEAKYAWARYYRLQKTADVLNLLADVYDAGVTTTFRSEGRAQMTGPKEQRVALQKQVLSLAESDALDKAGKIVIESISPADVLVLLDQDAISATVEKTAIDTTGTFGKVQETVAGDAVSLETKVRFEVRPHALNPYRTAAAIRSEAIKVMYSEYLRKYPVFALSPMQWEGKLTSVKANGEVTAEVPVASWTGLIAEGKLTVSKEIVERDYKQISEPFQLLLLLKLPQAVSGDQAKLEIVLSDHTKGMKRMSLEMVGSTGFASYAYQSFVPPIISLTAGTTTLANSRLRVGESIIRLDSQRPSQVSFELKNSEVAAYSANKLTRKMNYEGKVGQLKSILIAVPGYASIDSIQLYDNGVLVLSEEFNQEGGSGIMLNTMRK